MKPVEIEFDQQVMSVVGVDEPPWRAVQLVVVGAGELEDLFLRHQFLEPVIADVIVVFAVAFAVSAGPRGVGRRPGDRIRKFAFDEIQGGPLARSARTGDDKQQGLRLHAGLGVGFRHR